MVVRVLMVVVVAGRMHATAHAAGRPASSSSCGRRVSVGCIARPA
jgi:hypothetical protein